MGARAERTSANERPTRRTPTEQQASTFAPSRRQPLPFGPALTHTDVLDLQRTMGNRAVARMLAPAVQRDPNPAAVEAVEMVDAEPLVVQHETSVAQLRTKADHLISEAEVADGAETQDNETDQAAGADAASTNDPLNDVLVQADALESRIQADANRLDAASGTADSAPDDAMLQDELEQAEDQETSDVTSNTVERVALLHGIPADGQQVARTADSSNTSSVIQRAKKKADKKTEKHDRNYDKRARGLTTKVKKDIIKKQGVAGYKASAERDARRKAKAAAKTLDKKDPTTLVYKDYTAKITGKTHPDWKILGAAVKLYKALKTLGVMKEQVRWFQHTNTSGYITRGMRAQLMPGKANLMLGSNTAGTSDLYWGQPVLNKRKGSSGSALYIKGHLLNDHLGGAGLAHNLVPLTAEKETGASNVTGSNDANGKHSREVEGEIKKLLTGRTQVKSTVKYRVDSLAPSPDANRLLMTAQVQKFAKDFDAAVTNPAHATLTTPQLRSGVESADPGFAPGIGLNLMAAIGSGDSLAPTDAARLLLENAALWNTEDTQIPGGIECTASYEKNGAVKIAKTNSKQPMNKFRINNVLPTKFTAPYKP